MTSTKLRALALAPAAALVLMAGTAEAALTPTMQTTVRYCASDPGATSKLNELAAISIGEQIDARKGRVLLTVLHDASGRLDGARFYAGRFVFSQGKGR